MAPAIFYGPRYGLVFNPLCPAKNRPGFFTFLRTHPFQNSRCNQRAKSPVMRLAVNGGAGIAAEILGRPHDGKLFGGFSPAISSQRLPGKSGVKPA